VHGEAVTRSMLNGEAGEAIYYIQV
jgi:hypothetical protein